MCQIPNDPTVYVVFTNSSWFTVTIRHVIAVFVLIFCSFIRRIGLSGYENWTRANTPVGPSLNPSPPPIIVTQAAFTGLFTWILSIMLLFMLIPIGIDLLFLKGKIICGNAYDILYYIVEGFQNIGELAKRLLISIAT